MKKALSSIERLERQGLFDVPIALSVFQTVALSAILIFAAVLAGCTLDRKSSPQCNTKLPGAFYIVCAILCLISSLVHLIYMKTLFIGLHSYLKDRVRKHSLPENWFQWLNAVLVVLQHLMAIGAAVGVFYKGCRTELPIVYRQAQAFIITNTLLTLAYGIIWIILYVWNTIFVDLVNPTT